MNVRFATLPGIVADRFEQAGKGAGAADGEGAVEALADLAAGIVEGGAFAAPPDERWDVHLLGIHPVSVTRAMEMGPFRQPLPIPSANGLRGAALDKFGRQVFGGDKVIDR